MSAGNHAQGVAYHAQRLGLRAVIVMPRFHAGRQGGAHPRLWRRGGAAWRHAGRGPRHALALAAEQGLTFVHPYDDEAIVAGQGTVALEMLQAVPDLDTLVIAVGGGGLIAGMATAAKALKPGIASWACRPRAFRPCSTPSRARAPAGPQHHCRRHCRGHAGRHHPEIIAQLVDDLLLVDEGDIEQAIVMLLED
jgi:threonine dehydratase